MITIEEELPFVFNGKETNYLITESGIITNKITNRELKGSRDKFGYLRVTLTIEGEKNVFLVHRMVAMTFVPNPFNYPTVDHVDGNKKNNWASNLEWVTFEENARRANYMGLCPHYKGVDHHNNIYSNGQIRKVCELLVENKYEYSKIEKLTGVSVGVISRIRNKKAWTHISKEYPIPPSKHPMRKIPNEIKEKMVRLIKEGYNNMEILDKLNIPRSKNNSKIIRRLRKKL